MVLTQEMADNLSRQIDQIKMLQKAFDSTPDYISKSPLPEMLKSVSNSAISIVTNNNYPIINLNGDTVIYGASNDTVRKHEQISRRQVNEILKYIHVKP